MKIELKKLFKKARTKGDDYFKGFEDTMKVMLKREDDLITRFEKIAQRAKKLKVKSNPK